MLPYRSKMKKKRTDRFVNHFSSRLGVNVCNVVSDRSRLVSFKRRYAMPPSFKLFSHLASSCWHFVPISHLANSNLFAPGYPNEFTIKILIVTEEKNGIKSDDYSVTSEDQFIFKVLWPSPGIIQESWKEEGAFLQFLVAMVVSKWLLFRVNSKKVAEKHLLPWIK